MVRLKGVLVQVVLFFDTDEDAPGYYVSLTYFCKAMGTSGSENKKG